MGIFAKLDKLAHAGVQQPESYQKKHNYEFGDLLGKGTFGAVKKAVRLEDGKQVAIKIIPKKLVKGEEHRVYGELDILRGLDHANVIHFYDWFESRNKYYMVFELATGGELFDRLFLRGKFTEKDAIVIVKSILHGLAYLHANNIVHRDMKPENLLFKSSDSDADLVICDFGIAKTIDNHELLNSLCGSPLYVAPEVIKRQGHGPPVDIWAVGVITYMLLCGYQPFQGQDHVELLEKITEARYEFHERDWRHISMHAKGFIRQLLSLEPSARPTAAEALKHRWIAGSDIPDIDLLSTVRGNFNPRKALKNAVLAVSAMNKITSSFVSRKMEDVSSDDVIAYDPPMINIFKQTTDATRAPSTSTLHA